MKTLAFFPRVRYPAVSITATSCQLKCKFCMGSYLEGMIGASTPKQLYDVARFLTSKGARGILLSGGFNLEGVLPIMPFLSVVKEIKKDFDLVVSVHAGIVDKDLATQMRDNKVDVVDYEMMIDPVVIKEVQGLRKEPSDYVKSFELLLEHGPSYIAPHILIGSRYGKIEKEREAIDIVIDHRAYLMTFLIFIPTANTPMANLKPPRISDLNEVLSYSQKFKGEIALGCMRPPKYKSLFDEGLINDRFLDRIAVPRTKIAQKLHMNMVKACCSLPKEFFNRFLD